jgi:hypothetical protein
MRRWLLDVSQRPVVVYDIHDRPRAPARTMTITDGADASPGAG